MMNTPHTSTQDWINTISIGHTQETAFYFIPNSDGSIRWVWPASNKKPVFLKMYSASTPKAKLFSFFIQLLFVLRLQRLFVKKDFASFDNFPSDMNTDCTREWALFTGTAGPNRKLIIAGHDFVGQASFTKIALSKKAIQLVQNEITAIRFLSSKNLTATTLPNILSHSNRHVQLSDISEGSRSSNLSAMHLNSIAEINTMTSLEAILGQTEFYKHSLDVYRELTVDTNNKLPQAMKRKLQWLISELNENQTVKIGFSHKDFTPWNCFVTDNTIALYDLELSQNKSPFGYDAFHFVIQNGILTKRLSWSNIYEEIVKTILPTLFSNDEAQMKIYLKLYLLVNISYYLDLYSKQNQWHTQINWLLETWNDALSFLLGDVNAHRKLVLMDAFDFMQNRKYVALKFKGYLPEQVSENSDVDLCTSKGDAAELISYLENHSLVNIARVKNLSFMKNAELVLNDSSLLSIDCIWKLKRKNLIIGDIENLISSATTNVFGIKQPSALAEASYINHFYVMNKATTPMQYKSTSFELEMEKLANSAEPEAIQKTLKSLLMTQKVNKGISLMKNTLDYVIDIMKNILGPRGFIVTFSGVDGAGKSTLIEITKNKIDKQLRKPVVVLRHRPSVLPILSAWTMGKEVAEQKAATTLPRQGENTSTISSLARFSYYYTDYVLGQFYIYVKYVMRGKVVLYDRYYFDFINDSKRSNIDLPKWVTTLGYKLIMKPHVNFFLYADAETILARKQELDSDTIEELTDNYLSLFEKLNTTEKTKKYHAVKNLKLEDTINNIMTQLRLQVA